MFRVLTDTHNRLRFETRGRTVWVPVKGDPDTYTDILEAWVNLAISTALVETAEGFSDLSER